MKHLIAEELVKAYCSTCPSFRGAVRPFMFGLMVIRCRTGGERGGWNCDACTQTLTRLIKRRVEPSVVYALSAAVERQEL